VEELREQLRRSEAERAMLRAGRPETQHEAEMRQLRTDLRDAQIRAKAAEALAGGADQVSVVQEQFANATRQVDAAVERAKVAEGRADAAEDRARVAGELVTAAEQRIDLLDAKLQEIAEAGMIPAEDPAAVELKRQLDDALARVTELEDRAVRAESALAAGAGAVAEGPSEEVLSALEQRVSAAELQAQEASSRARAVEDLGSEREAVFRQRLGVASSGRKYGVAQRSEAEEAVDLDLRAAIARGLRGPLTRATGLVLSLQGAVGSAEDRDVLRQLTNSLRRLDRLTADLHDVERIADGTLPINRRRTDLAALVQTAVDETDRLDDRLVRVDPDRVHASVDPDRVRQIVEGMLDAARERTRSGAAIVVRVRDADTGARISVEDDNRTPAEIGPELSLATHLAALHGTEITVDGSAFRVVFPRDDG
jgi:K+-sensing histidine kinase KdpD